MAKLMITLQKVKKCQKKSFVKCIEFHKGYLIWPLGSRDVALCLALSHLQSLMYHVTEGLSGADVAGSLNFS